MKTNGTYVDIHCHMLPGVDDGSGSWNESLEMARMAVKDGIDTAILTPHQLGAFSHNRGEKIRDLTRQFQRLLTDRHIPLTVLPGADVRIDTEMVDGLATGDILSLGDLGKHVLLELPHEMYFPLEPVLEQLSALKLTGILSHPERNRGILQDPDLVERLVDAGCLMQVTASSLLGSFGGRSAEAAEHWVNRGLVHFLATDAHGSKARRPLLRRAFQRVVELVGSDLATELCCTNPRKVAQGMPIAGGRYSTHAKTPWWKLWRKVA